MTKTDEAVRLLQIGTERRRKAAMPLNPESSRSHAIYQIIIDRVYADNTRGTTSLYFADLMGSERLVEGCLFSMDLAVIQLQVRGSTDRVTQ